MGPTQSGVLNHHHHGLINNHQQQQHDENTSEMPLPPPPPPPMDLTSTTTTTIVSNVSISAATSSTAAPLPPPPPLPPLVEPDTTSSSNSSLSASATTPATANKSAMGTASVGRSFLDDINKGRFVLKPTHKESLDERQKKGTSTPASSSSANPANDTSDNIQPFVNNSDVAAIIDFVRKYRPHVCESSDDEENSDWDE